MSNVVDIFRKNTDADLTARFAPAYAEATANDNPRAYFDAGAAEARALIVRYSELINPDARRKVCAAANYLRVISSHTSDAARNNAISADTLARLAR